MRRFRPFVKPVEPIGPADRVLRRGVLNPSGSGLSRSSSSPVPPALSDRYIKSTDASGLFFTSALFEARLARSTP